MENKIKPPGTCAYCEEKSNRLFEPPLLKPDDWQVEVEDRGGACLWWHVPGQAFPGKDQFHTLLVDGQEYLRPYETPDEPICWECFDGAVWPAARNFCVNLPAQIKFNGYKKPEWVDI